MLNFGGCIVFPSEQLLSTLKRYKELEKTLYQRGAYAAGQTGRGLSRWVRGFFAAGRQKVTVMFVPHSERKALNFQVSRFALAGMGLLLASMIGASVFFLFRAGDTNLRLSGQIQENGATQGSLDAMRDETARLLKAADRFTAVLNDTLGTVGGERGGNTDALAKVGDLSNFFDLEERARGSIPEISELQEITDFLEQNAEKIKQLGVLYGSSDVMSAIPTLWPIKSGRGQLSMYFGQNRHPFTRQWYIHKGLDIITFGSGDPICATADGEVVQAAYSPDFGNYLILQHQFGFFTRYAHLQAFRVQKGQKVQQGQVIGYLGNSGLTTGPHLHYEIHLGTSVVDPLKYMNRPKPQAIAPAGNY